MARLKRGQEGGAAVAVAVAKESTAAPSQGSQQLDAAFRATMQQVFARQVTPVLWGACVAALVKEAQSGNVAAYRQLEPWAMGKASEVATLPAGGVARLEIVLPGQEPKVVA